MRMTMYGSPGATLIILLYALPGACMVLVMNSPFWTAMAGLFVFCTMHVHLYMNMVKAERLFWGNLKNPFFVLDKGPYTLAQIESKMPPHLIGKFIAVDTNEVEDKYKEVIQALTDSNNYLFLDPIKPLPVGYFYFRLGKLVNQTGKQYLKMCTTDMEKTIEDWHESWYESKDGNPNHYMRTFIFSGINKEY